MCDRNCRKHYRNLQSFFRDVICPGADIFGVRQRFYGESVADDDGKSKARERN